MISDSLKAAINELQYRIDRFSDVMLLIFDNEWRKDMYIKQCNEKVDRLELPVSYSDKLILITMEELIKPNGLAGRRFGHYNFMI